MSNPSTYLRILATAIMLLLLAMVLASCSRKTTQRAMTHTTASSDTARVSAGLTASDVRTLTELFTLSISTQAFVIDSIHTHIHTETTLDAEGNVIGRTMTEDTDRTRVGTSSAGSSSDHHVEASDSTASASSATANSVSVCGDKLDELTETVEKRAPWWKSILGDTIWLLIFAAFAGAAILLKRRKAKKRLT